ncbi:MAG: hypothetical protein ACPGUU_00360 [Flavobacteriaceae bacterium]
MKKILYFICIIFCIKISHAQTEATTDSIAQKNKSISFISYWSVGDSYNYKITKTKQVYKEDKLTKDTKNEYISSFTVIDSTANSYTISWKYENDLGNTFKLPKELTEKFSKYQFTEIKYKTSELGEFQEIINWKEVSELMSKMIDDIVIVLSKDDNEAKKVLDKSMEAFKQLYSSKSGIEKLVLKELQYFHFPLGYEFDTTKPFYYDDQLPNMLGGSPMKAKAKIYFESVDFNDGFCVMKQDLDVNPDDSLKFLKFVFKKLKITNDKLEKALKNASFNIKDRNIYEYYYDPGVPHKIETNRETNFNINNESGKRIDKTIIELQYNDDEELEE